MNENINHLLTQVGLITRKYDELAALTGERFNIFSVMSMESNEVYTHSAFLGELLHANGSHDLKDEPLQLFLETLSEQFNSGDKKRLFEFDTKDSWSVTEEYQGIINVDVTSGGRIDIVIKNKRGQVILIENKIYAGEQDQQLLRYNKSYPKAPILFLTLDGHQPNSCGSLKENDEYFCISYRKTIITWLEKCLQAAAVLPMLKEVIRQYIFLIKKLTNQTTNKKMEKDITNILVNNVDAAFEVYNNIANLKGALVKKTERRLHEYATKNDIKFISDYEDHNGRFYTKDKGFCFKPEDLAKENLSICFLFEHDGFFSFWFTLTGIEDLKEERRTALGNAFITFKYHLTPTNIWNYLFEGSDKEHWLKFEKEEMADEIIKIYEEILSIYKKA